MMRITRLVLVLGLATMLFGVPFGLMLGNFAKGEAVASSMAGYSLPDQGTNLRSADSADAVMPASVAYSYRDRHTAGSASWVD